MSGLLETSVLESCWVTAEFENKFRWRDLVEEDSTGEKVLGTQLGERVSLSRTMDPFTGPASTKFLYKFCPLTTTCDADRPRFAEYIALGVLDLAWGPS